jgi:hypothetical protein
MMKQRKFMKWGTVYQKRIKSYTGLHGRKSSLNKVHHIGSRTTINHINNY